MTPKQLQLNWKKAAPDEIGIAALTPEGLITMEPLFFADEPAGHDRPAGEILVAFVQTKGPIQTVEVCLPGLCGHYNCGSAASLSLN